MRRAILLLFLALPAFAQTAKFPTAVATDADLTVQKDKAQSTITAPMNASQTGVTVVTGSKFVAGMIVSIDNEQALVCSVVGTTVSFGYASCPNVDGRGYADTVAASHVNGSLISGNIVAWNHNSLKEEVKAIEASLGANLGNIPTPTLGSLGAAARGANSDITSLSALSTPLSVPQGGTGAAALTGIVQGNGASAISALAAAAEGQYLRRKLNAGATPTYEFATPSALASDDYNFAAQQPGGALAIGSNAFTLNPIPAGIAVGSYLYLSGGTGTAEAAIITGWNVGTGQVIVTCANTHSGAWTVRSASGGIQEALVASVSQGTNTQQRILLPTVDTFIYGKITIPSKPWKPAIHISGPGSGVPALIRATSYPSGDLFYVEESGGNYFSLHMTDFWIYNGGPFGSPVNTSGAAIHVKGNVSGEVTIDNFLIDNGYRGIEIESSGSVTVRGGKIVNSAWFAAGLASDSAIYMHDAGGTKSPSDIVIDGVVMHGLASMGTANTTSYGIRIGASDGIKISNSYIVQLKNAVLFNGYEGRTIANVNISDSVFDSFSEHVVVIQGNLAPGISDISVDNCWISARADMYPAVASLENVLIDASATASRLRFTNNWIVASKTAGFRTSGIVTNLILSGNHITDNNYSNTASEPGIYLAAGTTRYNITGNQVFNDPANVLAHQKYGLTVAGGDDGVVVGNTFKVNETAAVSLTGTITGLVLRSNLGIDDIYTENYIASETGANNAIAGALVNVPALVTGLQVKVKLAHTLQAGANTFALNGGAGVAIKSARNPASNIAVAYAATGTVTLIYDATGPYWLDTSQ